MAQINLLKQNTDAVQVSERTLGIAVKLFSVLLLGVVGYYIWLVVQMNKANNNIEQMQQTIAQRQQQLNSFQRHDQLVTRQGQLKQINTLLQNHIYWTSFLPELARVTLKTASYSTISVQSDGNLTLNVTVPDYRQLDKYLQVFDQPEFNQNFSDLKISGASQRQASQGLVTTFAAQLKYNTDILKYSYGQNNQ